MLTSITDPLQLSVIEEVYNELTPEMYDSKYEAERFFRSFKSRIDAAFTLEQAIFVFESLHPFTDNFAKSIAKARLEFSQVNVVNAPRAPEPVYDDTFTNSTCNCHWNCGLFSDNYDCCSKGGCRDTSPGCGFLWQFDCDSTCADESLWDCG